MGRRVCNAQLGTTWLAINLDFDSLFLVSISEKRKNMNI